MLTCTGCGAEASLEFAFCPRCGRRLPRAGEHALAFSMYGEALGLAERVGEPQLLFPCYDGLATLHLDAGNQALAERYLAKAQEVCERAGLEPDALLVLPFLC